MGGGHRYAVGRSVPKTCHPYECNGKPIYRTETQIYGCPAGQAWCASPAIAVVAKDGQTN
eukprot:COSAG01_NODE_2027_length_8600_cov_3.986356_6_plen_60_part_00